MSIERLSLPVRGAWIEIENHACDYYDGTSLPVRGAWIEIGAILQHLLLPFCRSP